MDLSQTYREHYPGLVGYLYRRLGDRARAEELAQETFVRAIRHCPENAKSWLYRVATNLALDEVRRRTVRRKHLSLVRPQEEQQAAPAPDDGLERRQREADVRAALGVLSERDRQALLLKEDGFNYDEIADQLGLSRGSIGTTLARARARFAAAFQRIRDAEGGEHAAR